MTRRAIVCRLDARMERPELRDFPFAIARVHVHRGANVAAAITIARAYRMAGGPNVCPPIGSYGEWTDAVRAPLIWLGEADPVESMDALREEDPELAPIRELFAHWLDAIPFRNDHTAAQIIDFACKTDRNGGFEHPEFHDLILRIAGDRGQPSSKSLGKWLTKINGRVVDNKRLIMDSDAKRGNRYKLVSSKVTTAASAPSKNAAKPIRRGLLFEADESNEW
jgi:putative DNA primase/helicase